MRETARTLKHPSILSSFIDTSLQARWFTAPLLQAKTLDVLSPRCKVFQPCWNPVYFAGCTHDWQIVFLNYRGHTFSRWSLIRKYCECTLKLGNISQRSIDHLRLFLEPGSVLTTVLGWGVWGFSFFSISAWSFFCLAFRWFKKGLIRKQKQL